MVDTGAQNGLSAKLDKKRKRQAEQSTKQDKPDTAPAAVSATGDGQSKRSKKLKKNKKSQAEQDVKSQDRKDGIDESIGKMDGRLLADYFAQRAKKLDKELSAVELGDLSVPGMNRRPFNVFLGNQERRLTSYRFCFPRYLIFRRKTIVGKSACFSQSL